MKKEEKEITDKRLLEIANRRRRELEAYEPQELQPLNDTPPDSQATVTKPVKARNRHAKKGKKAGKPFDKNLRELPKGEFIIVPNKFIEAMYKQNFGANQHKVLLYVLRKTWGWQKLSEFIRVTQCAKDLEIPKSRVSEALSSLVKRRIVTVNRNKTYGIQADTSLWCNPYRKKERNRNIFEEEP